MTDQPTARNVIDAAIEDWRNSTDDNATLPDRIIAAIRAAGLWIAPNELTEQMLFKADRVGPLGMTLDRYRAIWAAQRDAYLKEGT